MAAPSTGHPVSVTLGVIWNVKLDPQQNRPPRLTVAATIIAAAMTLARIIFGVVYMKDCPQQPNIPSYLLGLALMTLIMASWVILPCESSGAQPQSPPGCLKASLQVLVALCFFTWILAGDVWVFSVYQPNYDPTAADGLYCNKTLYTFAFWNAVWETLTVGTLLAKCCKGLLCCVLLQRTPPPPPNGDFNRNV